MSARHIVAVCAVAGGLALSACSGTTYDNNIAASDTTAAATTTTLPVGSLSDLLPAMVLEVQGLSEKVASRKGDDQSATVIEQYWAAIKPEVTEKYPDMVEDFEFVVRRCRAAADRSRPADADRAYRNLQALADAILG